MKRKNHNTTPIERVDSIHQDFEDLVVREILISEILILEILWEVFLVEDSADDLEEKASKVEKISK